MKIDWKKAIGLTAAVSMLVPLAACGGSSDGGDKNASGSTEAVTLSVWAPQEDQAKDTNWAGQGRRELRQGASGIQYHVEE